MPDDPRRALGRMGEELALAHLERLGLRELTRNHETRWGKIDLIVADEQTTVFVEVKTRRAEGTHPLDGLGPAKRRQVRRMAWAWLSTTNVRPRTPGLRFDAVAVTISPGGTLASLEHLEDAF